MTYKRSHLLTAGVLIGLLLLGSCVPLPPDPGISRVVSSAGIDTPTNATWYNGPTITVYSDDHATSKFSVAGSSGNTTVAGTLAVTGATTQTGVLAADGGITVDTSAFTVADTSGNTVVGGTLTVTGTSTLVDTVTVGGGYGDTGCSVSGAGVLQCNGAATTDGALTAGSAVIGGGYGSTGCSLSAAGVLQCNGAGTIDGALAADGGITVDTTNFTVNGTTGAVSSKGDITAVADATGGNVGAKNEFIGLPRIKLVSLAAGTNGTTETTSYIDDSPTGEYAPIGVEVTEAEGSVDVIYKYGASSYAATFTDSAAVDEGFKRTITTDDLEADTSIGLLLYPTVSVASADLQILLTDDGGARNFNIGALTANTWNWVEVDISALTGGTGDVVTEFGVTLTTQGAAALGAFVLYADIAYKWAAADEEALGQAIQQDGVLSVVAVLTAAAGANTTSDLVELTDYFVHYETGNDFIVWITDQSANSNMVLIAY